MTNAVNYAEQNLGVHEIFDKTEKARESLDQVYTTLSEHRDNKRRIESDIESLEMEIAIEERGKHADMSATAMDKHLKMACYQNADLKELRRQLGDVLDAIDGTDFDRKIHERDIEIGVARMTELGGYLNYLAAVKNASTARA